MFCKKTIFFVCLILSIHTVTANAKDKIQDKILLPNNNAQKWQKPDVESFETLTQPLVNIIRESKVLSKSEYKQLEAENASIGRYMYYLGQKLLNTSFNDPQTQMKIIQTANKVFSYSSRKNFQKSLSRHYNYRKSLYKFFRLYTDHAATLIVYRECGPNSTLKVRKALIQSSGKFPLNGGNDIYKEAKIFSNLFYILEYDNDSSVRQTAASALKNLVENNKDKLRNIPRYILVDPLIRFSEHNNKDIRFMAKRMLYRISPEDYEKHISFKSLRDFYLMSADDIISRGNTIKVFLTKVKNVLQNETLDSIVDAEYLPKVQNLAPYVVTIKNADPALYKSLEKSITDIAVMALDCYKPTTFLSNERRKKPHKMGELVPPIEDLITKEQRDEYYYTKEETSKIFKKEGPMERINTRCDGVDILLNLGTIPDKAIPLLIKMLNNRYNSREFTQAVRALKEIKCCVIKTKKLIVELDSIGKNLLHPDIYKKLAEKKGKKARFLRNPHTLYFKHLLPLIRHLEAKIKKKR